MIEMKGEEDMRVNRKKLLLTMLDLDMKVGQLVEKSGLSRCTVSAVRSGKTCSLETVQKLAQALGVEPIEITE
ncbi:MAG: helix-turn-helix transcriptional regulator [Paenibacillaceae bacterium]|nr:helix-turn-helix transcriptional regulator [Paenibacillaceae bacterium]